MMMETHCEDVLSRDTGWLLSVCMRTDLAFGLDRDR